MTFRWAVRLQLVLWVAAIGVVFCGDSPDAPQFGEFVVWVYEWNNGGLEGKALQILDTGESRTTDADGLARFRLVPGTYTLRAHNINAGGPPPEYIDLEVTVRMAQETRIQIQDCGPGV